MEVWRRLWVEPTSLFRDTVTQQIRVCKSIQCIIIKSFRLCKIKTLVMSFYIVFSWLDVYIQIRCRAVCDVLTKNKTKIKSMAGLLGRGKPHSVCIPVKHSVVLSDEDVAQDPQGPRGRRDVHCHETRQADWVPQLGLLRKEKKEVYLFPASWKNTSCQNWWWGFYFILSFFFFAFLYLLRDFGRCRV